MDAEIHETCEQTYRFSAEEFGRALTAWLADATDSLRKMYDVATRTERARQYDNCRLIIHALAALPKDGGTHAQLLQEIRASKTDYPSSNLSNYLSQLQSPKRGEVVLFDLSSGKYYFSSPMLHAYARALARQEFEGPKAKWDPLTNQSFFVFFAKEFAKDVGTKEADLVAHLEKFLYSPSALAPRKQKP